MCGVLDGEVEGLSRCERRNVTCTAQGKYGECTSDFLRIAGDVVVDADIGRSAACIRINGLIHLQYSGIADDVVVNAGNGCATAGIGINEEVF